MSVQDGFLHYFSCDVATEVIVQARVGSSTCAQRLERPSQVEEVCGSLDELLDGLGAPELFVSAQLFSDGEPLPGGALAARASSQQNSSRDLQPQPRRFAPRRRCTRRTAAARAGPAV